MKTAKKSSNLDMQNYFFNISGSTVTDNIQLFRRKPNAMKDLFGQLLEIDKRCIDCHSLVKTDQGLQCGITIFSFDPKQQCRSNTILKTYQAAVPRSNQNIEMTNTSSTSKSQNQILTLFAKAVIEIWKLNSLLHDNNDNNIVNDQDKNWDIQLTDIVAFFETENKSKHANYFETDWKNIVESNVYQSNASMFSSNKIGIYQAICVTIDSNTIQTQPSPTGDAITAGSAIDVVYVDDDGNINTDTKQQPIKGGMSDDTQTDPESKRMHIDSSVENEFEWQDIDQSNEMKSKDDLEINITTKEDKLGPITSMNYSKSGIVANFEAMAAMMDQMRDFNETVFEDDKLGNKQTLKLPALTKITTHFSHNDHVNSNKSITKNDEKQRDEHIDAVRIRSRSVSISAPIGFSPI